VYLPECYKNTEREGREDVHFRKRSFDDVGLHVVAEQLVIPEERRGEGEAAV
jgi:hypothetical protein